MSFSLINNASSLNGQTNRASTVRRIFLALVAIVIACGAGFGKLVQQEVAPDHYDTVAEAHYRPATRLTKTRSKGGHRSQLSRSRRDSIARRRQEQIRARIAQQVSR